MAGVVEVGGGAAARPTSTGSEAARRYVPLLSMLIAVAIVLAVLPSALNLPQSNPTQTLEYAPIPPEDDEDTPPQGNLSALGLGSSSGIDGEGAAGGEGAGGGPPETLPPPKGGPPTMEGFRCVGSNPPRQTEDPLAPPCVPFFDADNYGATYRGVTGKEIRLLIYIDGSITYITASNPGDRTVKANELHDLWEPPKSGESEHLTKKALRGWQTYFNLRFQKYGRQVHFYVFYSSARTSDSRREDAARMLQAVNPFAVISFASEGFEDDFLKGMARKGVLNFGSFGARPESFFQSYPKMIWGYLPSVEQQAKLYVSYVCQKVLDKPAVLAGGTLANQPRKLGMIYTIDDKQEGLRRFAELVKSGVEGCGGKIDRTAPFKICCLAQNGGGDPAAGTQMAEFRQEGITTILWPGGISGDYGKAASGQGYFPEWIIAGDATMDANYPIVLSANSPSFDGRAIVITPQTLEPGLRSQRCYQAYREVDQSLPDADLRYTCEYYRDLFQFFTGIQVAGPRLGPSSVDKGFHEIPHKYVGTPTIPACFYEVADYTCVKDAQAEIWRADKVPPGANQSGCWTAIDSGRRYAPGQWPAGNIDMGAEGPITGNEQCNGYDNSVRFNT